MVQIEHFTALPKMPYFQFPRRPDNGLLSHESTFHHPLTETSSFYKPLFRGSLGPVETNLGNKICDFKTLSGVTVNGLTFHITKLFYYANCIVFLATKLNSV